MADADKNIVITPNVGQTTEPNIVFTGQDNTDITLTVLDYGGLSISGASGELFSIIDSAGGTIFSVNDVSGVPSIEVDDDGTIRLAEFAGNVLLGTATDNGTDLLQVDGSISATSMSATTFTGALSGNASTASTLQTARTISLGGVLSGSASFNGGSNITITAAHTSDPTLTINGDASGSATFTNLGNATLTLTVADDSHNHVISNVDGLQTALDAKLPLSGGSMTGTLALNNSDSLSFENGNHWITYNDGKGNFNLRVGHSPSEVSTEAGYAFHDEWSQSGGWRQFNISSASLAVGNTATWRAQMEYDANAVYLRYQGGTRVTTTNAGVTINGTITATAGSTLIIYNSAGTALKTIKGIS